MIEKFLVPKDSFVGVEKSEVDGKTFITVTVEPKRKFKVGDKVRIKDDILKDMLLDINEKGYDKLFK